MLGTARAEMERAPSFGPWGPKSEKRPMVSMSGGVAVSGIVNQYFFGVAWVVDCRPFLIIRCPRLRSNSSTIFLWLCLSGRNVDFHAQLKSEWPHFWIGNEYVEDE